MAKSINDALESLRLTLISGLDPHRPIRGTCPAGPTTIWRAFTRFTNDTTAQFKTLQTYVTSCLALVVSAARLRKGMFLCLLVP